MSERHPSWVAIERQQQLERDSVALRAAMRAREIAYGSKHPTAPHLCGTCFYDKPDCVCLFRHVRHTEALSR